MPVRGRRPTCAYASAIGATEGSIIAAVVVTQTPRYEPREARPIRSMPRINSKVAIHAASEPATSAAAVRKTPVSVTRPEGYVRPSASHSRR